MRANCNSIDLTGLFAQIFAAAPWPMLMLSGDGAVICASDECEGASEVRGDAPMRERAPHYLSTLRGIEPWLLTQEADSVRSLPSGKLVYERLRLRRTPWGASLMVVDETHLRQMQTADVQTARLAALGFMVAGVSHELTNPLTSLHSIVQFLRSEKQPSRELIDKGLENIAVNVKRILDISRRLVNFSRVGDEPRVRFAVDDIIEEALHVMRDDGLLRGVELHHERDPAAKAFGNAGQVREIFLNVFVNAVQAMAGHGELRIAMHRNARMVEVLVSDTGPGVPAAAAGRIFEPFFTTKAGTHGTGLGLAICTEIAHEHGGRIELMSGSEPGATFRISLPQEAP